MLSFSTTSARPAGASSAQKPARHAIIANFPNANARDIVSPLSTNARDGAGRPRQDWELTAAGHARFPDTHAQLTVQLIGSIRQLFGQAGLDKLIEQREVQMRAEYQQHCGRLNSLPRKLEKLAELRSAEGYMARVEKHGKQWLLIEDHCPICAAAQSCQGFCRSELQLFGEVLGEQAEITREEHLLAEGRRCVYRITALASG